MVILKTERLIIRDPKPEDINGHHRLLSDELIKYYWPNSASASMEQSRRDLEDAINEANSDCRDKYFFTIELSETGEYVGTIGYTVVQRLPVGKIVGAGYAILPEFRRYGYTTEAFRALLYFAFEKNGVYRMVAGCRAENKASERVMQKCGMIKEADFRCHTWHDGVMKDRVEYRLLKDEFHRMAMYGCDGAIEYLR